MINRVLGGRYRIIREVASGATGVVWRAVDLCCGEPVAVKTLRPRAAGRPDLVAAFVAETELVAGLDHPCLVRPRDVLGQGPERALVMELVEGRTCGGGCTAPGRSHRRSRPRCRHNSPVRWPTCTSGRSCTAT
ncbi:hypothetical protein [Plantactinospora veratri]